VCAVQLLTVVTEGNTNNIAGQFNDACVSALMAMMADSKAPSHVRVGIAGLLLNVRPGNIEIGAHLTSAMAAAIELDPFASAESLVGSLLKHYEPMKAAAEQFERKIASNATAKEQAKAVRKAAKAQRKLSRMNAAAAGAKAAAAGPQPSAAPPAASGPTGPFAFSFAVPTNGNDSKTKGGKGSGGGGGGSGGGGDGDSDDELDEDEKALNGIVDKWTEMVSGHVREWCDTAHAVEHALEIIARICTTDEKDDGGSEGTGCALPPPIVKQLQSGGVIPKVMSGTRVRVKRRLRLTLMLCTETDAARPPLCAAAGWWLTGSVAHVPFAIGSDPPGDDASRRAEALHSTDFVGVGR
jgi:hypothetical protein